jgi:hypothetical protein
VPVLHSVACGEDQWKPWLSLTVSLCVLDILIYSFIHFMRLGISIMLTPDQFEVNEAWIAVRINEEF